MRLLVCAGGTGGGIYPALTAVTELLHRGLRKEDVLWVGTAGEMEETLVPRAGLTLTTIRGGAIAGVPLHVKVLNAAKLAWSLIPSWRILRQFRPNVMLMTGGYMSVPVALAARLRRVPIVIFLPDVEPGAAIKAVMPLATKIACTSPDSSQYVPVAKMAVTGYPLRHELQQALHMSRVAALAQFDLQPGRPTLLVFGGSRGSQAINRALMAALPQLLTTMQIIHISGTFTWPEVEANLATLSAEQRAFYRAYPYLHEEMGAALRAADLMVTRSGASVMGEAPAFGLPAILVPLTWAWRYQKVNADFLTKQGAAVQLTDETLAAKLATTVQELLHDEVKMVAMKTAVQALHTPEATAKLAEVITTTGQGAGLS
ncbi:MAG: UDP-N-acetylglucosamine--N-acetylmuramyl-(pentapeptide) pyrophosphoryl-undecaprenol N-acetylglucosamine transferase [Anaerolineales bacterium]|nr:UDP-N-acetylglucosamine--N-acetylmuramyl-(pentapeptide) pyrophosphoryl-undecaprenol N-acetylglucosamine transferase [Anaerolineales bacterium]